MFHRLLGAIEFEIVQCVQTAEEAITKIHQTDMILTAVILPGMNGASMTSQMRRSCPSIKIAALTRDPDTEVTFACLAAGAFSFVDIRDSIARQVSRIAEGYATVTPYIAGEILKRDLEFTVIEKRTLRNCWEKKKAFTDYYIIPEIYRRLEQFFRPRGK